MTNVISVEPPDESDNIFNVLKKNKKFFAVSISEIGTVFIHKNKINNQEIIYVANLIIHSIMKDDLIK